MIEVEIRGMLNKEGFQKLKEFLEKEGEFVEDHDREMILLYDYPGYDRNPNARLTDIRLRKTNDDLEIMVKHKVSDNNVGREEISLGLKEGEWDTAKKVLKALGFSRGLWMQRNKSIYRFHDIEWSLVQASESLFYFEAEQESSESGNVERIHAHLTKEAETLGLAVLGPEDMRQFIHKLDTEVNKEVEW